VAVGLSDEFLPRRSGRRPGRLSRQPRGAPWRTARFSRPPRQFALGARKRKRVHIAASASWRSRRGCAAWWPSASRQKSKPSACCFSGHRTAGASHPRRSLRLLLALGHQIGMAVENSYLIQQTSRRTEELHVLNEIGPRAQLDSEQRRPDKEGVGRAAASLRCRKFYIAELDPLRDEIQFDLEIVDGARLPKRARPAGNHITEYIIRTRQPVLIRDKYVAEMKKLASSPCVQPGASAACRWWPTITPLAPWPSTPTMSALF